MTGERNRYLFVAAHGGAKGVRIGPSNYYSLARLDHHLLIIMELGRKGQFELIEDDVKDELSARSTESRHCGEQA